MFLRHQTLIKDGRNQKEHMTNLPLPGLRTSLLAYIDGTMPADERELFERRLLEEDEFSEQIALAEQDLLDDYAAGTLSVEQKDNLDSWVLSSDRRREHVRLTRALLLRSQLLARKSRIRYWPLAAAVAACMLISTGVVWLYPRHHPPIAVTADVHSSKPAIPIHRDVILLNAERVRGATQEATYEIHAGSPISLQVVLPAKSNGTTFSLLIRSERKLVEPLRYEGLVQHQMGDLSYVEVALPARTLAAGHYTAQLTTPNGPLTALFRVVILGP